MEAASPLFNGNTDYAGFKRKDGVPYFNQTYDPGKWEKAAAACRNAIDTCHLAEYALFYFQPSFGETMSPKIVNQMSIRNSVCENSHTLNNERVWANPNSTSNGIQFYNLANIAGASGNSSLRIELSVPLKIAEMFYTANGIPMNEDREWESSGKYSARYSVKTAGDDDKDNVSHGFETAQLNLGRETRFYANLYFDGNLFYGFDRFNSTNQWVVHAKFTELAGRRSTYTYNVSGYFCKKLLHYQGVIPQENLSPTIIDYSWPVIRLADLYLLCSEALNEAYGPSLEAYQWIDLVRERAGLEGVVDSWKNYARASLQDKPKTPEGFREIIQRERLIELANEGHRYWEIRRWKKARETWHNQPIQGWDVDQKETETYYRVRTVFTQQFTRKNYFWPIRESDLPVNPNLDQNPEW